MLYVKDVDIYFGKYNKAKGTVVYDDVDTYAIVTKCPRTSLVGKILDLGQLSDEDFDMLINHGVIAARINADGTYKYI